VTIARPFNTFGPRQSARAVIPTIISQALSSSKSIRLGSLAPKRDLNYVKDVCDGFVKIAGCDEAIGRAINICSGREISVGELAGLILKKMRCGKAVSRDNARVRPSGSEVGRLMGDNSLVSSLTGWEPAYTLEKGLSETIKWFSSGDNIRRYKEGIYNI
jgi:nucleoside-diphosphate-sugar epimerase